MQRHTVFNPSSATGSDNWTETGVPTGTPQPPNRALPAPIFDLGTSYSPNNGSLGNWVISKTVASDIAGAGSLIIPAGTFPVSGGIYADDIVAAVRLNGVALPFTGIGTGTLPPQVVPVTWLAGANTLEIEIANTVAGNTSVAGRLLAESSQVPCDCCPTGPPQCALVGVSFDSVAETAAQAGWNQLDLWRTIDGVPFDGSQAGYNTTTGNTPSTTLRVTYGLALPQNRVRGVRIWNQGGSDLNDADGLNNFTAEFYAGATLLTTATWQVGNGGAAQTRLLPLGQELTGVDRVVLRTLDKQIGGSIAPEWREFQLVVFNAVFPCRRSNGTVEWYDANGNLVPQADVINCQTPPQPWVAPTVLMQTSAFGDDPSGTAENICNVLPSPSATTGWAAPVSGCYDPVVGTPSMTWTSTSTVELEYANGPGGQPSGAVFMVFSTTPGGVISWPVSSFDMNPGDTLTSNLIPGGHRAVLTYLSGPLATSPSRSIQSIGSNTLRIHGGNVSAAAPIRFRIDFINA